MREDRDYKQWQIAEYLNCSQQVYSHYELGQRDIPTEVLIKLSALCKVSTDYLLGLAANRRMDILYDYLDGTTAFDDVEDSLPFDIHAPVIEISDEDYALWYRDVTEEPQKYHNKTVKFKAQIAMLRREKENMFAPGRFVMTCCVDDIQFCGIPCHYPKAKDLKPRG